MDATRRFLLLVVVSAAFLSCTPDDGKTVTRYSEPALDGVAVEVGGTTYTAEMDNAIERMGDNSAHDVMRCVVSFDLGTLPAEVQIESATLRMYQEAIQNGNSYDESAGLGTVLVDNISYDASTTPEFLWHGSTTGTDIGIGPLASSFSANVWHEIDVTLSAKFEFSDYHNGRLQFRVYHHYLTNHDSTEDSDEWVMGDSPTHRPELVIVYR